MTEMVEFFKLSYYSYRGGKKLHQICSATCIYRTVFELKNILASIDIPFFDAWQSGLAIVCGTKWPIHLLYWSAGQKHTLKDGQLIVIIFLEALVAGTVFVYNKV